MKFASMFVACSRGEADPCGEAQVFTMDSLDEAIELVKDQGLDEVAAMLQDDEELTEADTEFFTETGKVGELGWVECGEEGMMLIAPETSKWFNLFQEADYTETGDYGVNWDEETWKEFSKILGGI